MNGSAVYSKVSPVNRLHCRFLFAFQLSHRTSAAVNSDYNNRPFGYVKLRAVDEFCINKREEL